jgi:hypothetical protein
MADDRGRTEHTEEPAEGGREEGEAAEARVREEQQDDEEERPDVVPGGEAR